MKMKAFQAGIVLIVLLLGTMPALSQVAFSIDTPSESIGTFDPGGTGFNYGQSDILTFFGPGGIDVGGVGPAIQVPDLFVPLPEVNAISLGGHSPLVGGTMVFSVSRGSTGLAGAVGGMAPNVSSEAANFQQAADIYASLVAFGAPALFAPPGGMGVGPGGGGFAGLGPFGIAGPGNTLAGPAQGVPLANQTLFNLTPTLPAGVLDPQPPPVLRDNLDAFEAFTFAGSNIFYSVDQPTAPTIGPFGVNAADILVDPAATYISAAVYAAAGTLGLDLFGANTDDVDAMVLFDDGDAVVEPGIDFALFSLGPASLSLVNYVLSPADVFVTAFLGTFAYLPGGALLSEAATLGLNFADDIDALEFAVPPIPTVPEPGTIFLLAFGLLAVGGYGWGYKNSSK